MYGHGPTMCDRASVFCHALKVYCIWLQIVAFDRYSGFLRPVLSKPRRTAGCTRSATSDGQRNQARYNQKTLNVPRCTVPRPQQFQLVHVLPPFEYYFLLLFGCLHHPSASLVKEVDSAILVGNEVLCKTTMSVPGSRNLHKAKLLVSTSTRIADDPHQRTHQRTHQSLAPGTDSGPLVYSEYSFILGGALRVGSKVVAPQPPSPRSVPGKGP